MAHFVDCRFQQQSLVNISHHINLDRFAPEPKFNKIRSELSCSLLGDIDTDTLGNGNAEDLTLQKMLAINNQFILQSSSSVAPLEGWDLGQDSLCPAPPSEPRQWSQTQNRDVEMCKN